MWLVRMEQEKKKSQISLNKEGGTQLGKNIRNINHLQGSQ